MLTGKVIDSFYAFITKVIINLLLLNGWTGIINDLSINRVSWYMSTVVLCVLLTPLIVLHLQRITVKTAKEILILLLFLKPILSIGIECIVSIYHLYWINANWMLYTFPPIRVIDFAMGCILGKIYLGTILDTRNRNTNSKSWKKLCLSITSIVIANYICIWGNANVSGYGDVSRIMQALLYPLPTCWLIWCFATYDYKSNIVLSKIIYNSVVLRLGKLTAYMYLIHNVVFEYLGRILWRLLGKEGYIEHRVVLNCTLGFALTVLLALIYHTIIIKLKKYRVFYVNR